MHTRDPVNLTPYICNKYDATCCATAYLFTGLKFLKKLNKKSSLSQNSQYYSAFVSVWPHIYSASSRSQHTLFTLCHSDQTIIITQKSLTAHSDMLHLIYGTSFLHHSGFLIQIIHPPLNAATIIWTYRFNLLHSAITFHHFLTASLLSLKPTFSENLILHLSLFLSIGLISWL